MDMSKLIEGQRLLSERDELLVQKRKYELCGFKVVVGSEYLKLTKEEMEAVSKIFIDKLDAQIAEIDRKIAEL